MKNINRVFLFGDSWIEGEGCCIEPIVGEMKEPDNLAYVNEENPDTTPEKSIRAWRRNNTWNKFFKDKYGLGKHQIKNWGVQGGSNYQSFRNFNKLLHHVKPTDLILFGFTSKYRDSTFALQTAFQHEIPLTSASPVFNNEMISYEKIQVDRGWNLGQLFPSFWDIQQGNRKPNEYEQWEWNFTREYCKDFITTVFDEKIHENIAQTNYLFYQKWCKMKGINIIFFDLFESYIDSKFVNPYYEVDESMYITYNKKHYFDRLLDYEWDNYTEDAEYTVWQQNTVNPCGGRHNPVPTSAIPHPNQFGYKFMFDDITENHIDGKYNFVKTINEKSI